MTLPVIRRMEVRDMEAVRALHLQLFPVRYGPEFYGSLLTSSLYMAWVMTDEGRIIGVATISRRGVKSLDWWGLQPVNVAYLCTFGVHEKHRRNGLGRLLLLRVRDELLSFSPAPDCIALHVKTLNSAAKAFYDSQGFLEWRTVSFAFFFLVRFLFEPFFSRIPKKPNHYRIQGTLYDALKMGLPLSERGLAFINQPMPLSRRLRKWISSWCDFGAFEDDDDIVDDYAN